MINNNLPLLEIHDYYLDFCQYMVYGLERYDAEKKLDFIIKKLRDSSFEPINDVALSLVEYKEEILNFYSVDNKYHLSNGIAKGNNAKIMQIIRMSSGFKSYKILRKRVLWISQNQKE